MKLETAGRSMWRNFTEAKTEKCMITKKWRKRYQGMRKTLVLVEEVRAAIKELKNNKASGIDNIPAEMLKSLEEGAMTELTRICQDIYTTGVWPEDFLQSIIIPIKKK